VLDPGTVADRFQVVVHVDAKPLPAGAESSPSLPDDGSRVSAETSRRIARDAVVVVMRHAADGSVLDVGRRTRTISTPLRRALAHRDSGCQFPGCGLRLCDARHLPPWADAGKTKLDNLIQLCRRHHRAVHAGLPSWDGSPLDLAWAVDCLRAVGRSPHLAEQVV